MPRCHVLVRMALLRVSVPGFVRLVDWVDSAPVGGGWDRGPGGGPPCVLDVGGVGGALLGRVHGLTGQPTDPTRRG